MLQQSKVLQTPFLLRFQESESVVQNRPPIASPERGGESNPKEEEPKPEETKKTPWGD
jgi:hypothetical protein